jgi:hypothetical protein
MKKTKRTFSDEKRLEAKLARVLKRHGWLCEKLKGQGGWPDRTLLGPGRETAFCEVKRTGGELDPLQVLWRVKLERMGFKYFLVNSDQVIDEIEQYVTGL